MAFTDPVWVFIDAAYQRRADGFSATAESLGVQAQAPTRDESHHALTLALSRHLRPLLVNGTLPSYLEDRGYYRAPTGEWIPRVTGGDERLYVRVTPLEPLVLVEASDDPDSPDSPDQ